jgi:hypothetical protein
MLRLIIGLTVAALWLPLVGLLHGSWEGQFFAGAVALFTVPLTLVVAAPVCAVFYYSKVAPSWWFCMIFGGIVGFLGAMIFAAISNNSLIGWNSAPGFILVGVISALMFWAIGIRKNDATFHIAPD